jgi:hypothetical protein
MNTSKKKAGGPRLRGSRKITVVLTDDLIEATDQEALRAATSRNAIIRQRLLPLLEARREREEVAG